MEPLNIVTPQGVTKGTESQAVGAYICKRMEQVVTTAVALRKLSEMTINHGGHLVCIATTLCAGLGSIYNGDFFTGGAITAVAAREAYNLLSEDKTDVQQLLQDASAGIDMIKTLEQANQKSFENVDGNLNLVSQNMLNLEERLNDIRLLATQENKEIEEQKEKTLLLYQQAHALFTQTHQILNQSKQQIGTSNDQFAEALNQIGDLVELAQEEEGDFKDRAEQFAELSQQIYKDCTQAKETLEQGNQALNQGLSLLNGALIKFNEATFEAGIASHMVNTAMEKIKDRAQVEENCHNKIDEIRTELNEVKLRNQDIQAISDEVQADINEAKRKSEEKFGLASVILGGGLGAMFGAVASGGTAAAAGAVTGTVAYHNREKIGDFLFGKDPEPVPAKPTNMEPVTFKFNDKSSGFWGRYIAKRPSFTKGKVSIDLANGEILTFKYDLNAKHKVAKNDLRNLFEKLSKLLNEDPQYAGACLNILNKLETKMIDRGDRHRPSRGFISAKDPYFADLKRRATRNLANNG